MIRGTETPARAVALVRISDDRDDTRAGVGRQEEDCRALATRLGWQIAEVIVENDTSAYKTKAGVDADGLPVRRTRRPEFRRALQLLNAGRADGLIVYDIDRLARQPRDLEALIDLVETRQVPVVAVTGGIDLSNSAGVAMARVLMAMANKSSADTARRVARAHVQQAQEGRPPGGWRAYGYEADRRTLIPAEAEVIREIADRIIAGDSLRTIRTDLDRRGIRPPHADKWSSASLRSVVSKPMTAGLRTLKGEVMADGQWPAILDRQTWELVRAVLANEERKTGTRAVDRHLLAGIATCGLCGAPMYVGTNGSKGRRKAVYKCSGCARLSRSQPWLDDHVTAVVRALLDRDTIKAARRTQAAGGPGRTLTTLAALKARRRDLLREFATNIAADDLRVMLDAVDEKIAALELEAANTATVGVRLPASRDFDDLTLDRRRAIVRHLVRVTVNPATKAGTANDPDSILVEPAY